MLGAAVAAQSPIRRASPGAPAPDPRDADEGRRKPLVAPERSPATPLSEPPPDASIPVIPESPEGSLLWRLRGMLRSMRPHQWVKNLFVLAPVVFAKELTSRSLILSALGAFAVFCLLAGAVYTLNDLVDAPADRVHPVKRFRPIASGRVPIPVARAMVVVLVVAALGGAAFGPSGFLLVAAAYFVQNVAYSFALKRVAYLDVGFIALGFVLRVLAGGYATRTHVSGYMIACTALLALFQGFGKRRHELASANAAKQRASLEAYSPRTLTIALAITGFGSVANYLAYALDGETERFFGTSWLWVTTIHPIFGVVRFLQLVVGRPKSESPTQEMLRDVPFVLNVVLWVIEVIALLYHVKLQ
jgi:decaprenyl-phosphate phosphoribosyltransferase